MNVVQFVSLLFITSFVDINAAMTASRRVINGIPAPPGKFPYFVQLFIPKTDGKSTGICGGGVISNQFVLTAAHCVNDARSIQCVFQLSNLYDPDRTINVDRSGIIIHSQFNPKTLANDIALLHLPRAVKNTIEIKKLEMPDPNKSYEDITVQLAGHGLYDNKMVMSEKLLYFEPKVVNLNWCKEVWNHEENLIWVTDNNICTKDQKQPYKQCTCRGDSGGPLAVANGGTHTIIGLSSFSVKECDPIYPQVFTRVSSYISWIKNNTNGEISR